MSDKTKTLAESAFCDLLAMPLPKPERDFRRAIILACLIGRQMEHDFQQNNSSKPTNQKHRDTMKREILLEHECVATAAKNGLAGLPELAQHLHLEKGIQRGDAVINMDCSDDPTSTTGFYFSPACGEGGIIQATVGASHGENGLEGVRFLFQPQEAAEAQKALLTELGHYDEPENTARFSVVPADVW